MIQRINLIEKQALSFSYEKIVRIFAGIFFLNVLFGAYPVIMTSRMNPKIAEAHVRLKEVTNENMQLTTKQKKPIKQRVTIGEYQQLFDTLQALPKWSKLVKMISVNLPSSVWINSLKAVGTTNIKKDSKNTKEKAVAADKNKKTDLKKQDEVEVISKNKIEITGVGSDVKAIADFAAKLSKSPAFVNLQLSQTLKESYGYTFTIISEVTTDYAEQ